MNLEVDKLIGTPAINNPWQHFICEGFYSTNNLAIIKNFFKNNTPNKEDIISKRKFIELKYSEFSFLQEHNHSCYCSITKKCLDKYPQLESIVEIFKNIQVIKHFNKLRGDNLIEDSTLRVQIIRDIPGYSILPHPDNKFKLLTFQCYFPNEEGDLGTMLYNQDKIYEKSIPYKNNISYWFIPKQEGIITWHGFVGKEINAIRDTVMVNYMFKDSVKDGIKLYG